MYALPLLPSHSSERDIALAVTILSKDGDNVCSAFELSVNAFYNIGRSEPPLHLGRAINDGEAFFNILFKPIGQLVLFIYPEN